MKDIGCLTINEDKSNTVHIGKLKDGTSAPCLVFC